jgi:hypothetical protein
MTGGPYSEFLFDALDRVIKISRFTGRWQNPGKKRDLEDA